MNLHRRQFLKTSALAGGALGLEGFGRILGADEGVVRGSEGSGPEKTHGKPRQPSDTAPRSLDLLILGGTSFLGPHQVRYALERGHNVSIFTRGRTQPQLFRDAFRQVEHLVGVWLGRSSW